MKRYITLICAVAMGLVAHGQIMLTPYVDVTVGGLNDNNVELLENKLRSCISSVDMVSSYNTRFLLGTHINVLEREYSQSAPVQIIQHLCVTMAIGDGMAGACFGSCTFEVKGIGRTEEEALLSAIKNFPRKNEKITRMVVDSKDHIIKYYDENGASIIKQAEALAINQDWDQALYLLSAIPQECVYYNRALSVMMEVYESHINSDAEQVLLEAQAVWSADPNPGPNAELAMSILSQINTSATCYPRAVALMKKIETRVQSVTDTRYVDEVALERQRINAYTTLEKQRIKACRDVAVAYAKRQPRVVYHVHRWW